MPTQDLEFSFSKSSPFYQMVGAFRTALLGFQAFSRSDNPMGWKPQDVLKIESVCTKDLIIDFYDQFRLVQSDQLDQPQYFSSLCCMLMNTAYESVKQYNDNSPEFEFFRHVRNVSSHANAFNFFKSEPRRPASWRTLTIDHRKKGVQYTLFGKKCFMEYLAVPEAIFLLNDIDRKLR